MKNLLQITTLPILLLLVFVSGNSCKKNHVLDSGVWDMQHLSTDSVSFVILGDWGRFGGGSQVAVADQIHVISKRFNAQFIISTGDNFYTKGVTSVDDPHWSSSFEYVYNKEGHQAPWYPVLGNHDYQSNPQAQVDYSRRSNRWKMPARYYSLKKNINDSDSALFVFTDTSPFVSQYYAKEMSDLKEQDTAAQFSWLRQSLTTSNDQWKIVIGHHPVYSVGTHGNTPEMVDHFKPLFNQTGTDFYIAGHDHSLQHISYPGDRVHYLVSGGGATNTAVNPNDQTLFARSTPGFLVMTLYPQRANFYFYNQRGELLHRRQVIK